MAAVHILILSKLAGFKIVPFIATHVKMKFFFHGDMEKKKKKKKKKKNFSQSELANFDIKLLSQNILEIILLKCWIFEFMEISILLNHSVTIDNSADSTLIILASKRKYSTLSHQCSNDLSECLAYVLGKNGTASVSKSAFCAYSKI